MKILVLIKPTPDTETKIQLGAGGASIDMAGVKSIINPYDEYAIEEALKVKEASGGQGEVVVVTFAQDSARELVIKGLAMGADRGLIVNSAGLDDLDARAISKVLSKVAAAESADLVFAGKQAIDDDNMHVPPMVAEHLGWPHVNVVTKFSLSGKTASVEREVEGGQVEVFEVTLPVVIGAHKSLNSPRYASLPGIMKAKKKPLDIKTVGDFGLDPTSLKSMSRTRITGYRLPAAKSAGKKISGDTPEAMARQVIKLLREEAKVL